METWDTFHCMENDTIINDVFILRKLDTWFSCVLEPIIHYNIIQIRHSEDLARSLFLWEVSLRFRNPRILVKLSYIFHKVTFIILYVTQEYHKPSVCAFVAQD